MVSFTGAAFSDGSGEIKTKRSFIEQQNGKIIKRKEEVNYCMKLFKDDGRRRFIRHDQVISFIKDKN